MTTVAEALQNLRPGSKWFVEGNDYAKITWLDDSFSKPTKDEVDLEIQRLVKLQYVDNRKEHYPSIGDQLDDLFKAGLFSKQMAAKIQAVKDQFPKPE